MQTALIPDGATSLWIGLTDDGSEGVWYWEHTRNTPNISPWDDVEPNGGTTENCVCSAHLVLGGTTRVQIFFLSFAKSRRHNHQEKHTHKEISVLYIYKKKTTPDNTDTKMMNRTNRTTEFKLLFPGSNCLVLVFFPR